MVSFGFTTKTLNSVPSQKDCTEVPLNAPSVVEVGETLVVALCWCLYPHKVSSREKTVFIEQER